MDVQARKQEYKRLSKEAQQYIADTVIEFYSPEYFDWFRIWGMGIVDRWERMPMGLWDTFEAVNCLSLGKFETLCNYYKRQILLKNLDEYLIEE